MMSEIKQLVEPAEFDLNLTVASKCSHLFALSVCGIACFSFLIAACQPDIKPRIVWILFSLVFLTLFLLLISQKGLKNGYLLLNAKTLVIEQRGRSTVSDYDDIAKIALTRVMSGRSLTNAVLVETKNYSRTYIKDQFQESPEEIFGFLKQRLAGRIPSVSFVFKKEITSD